MKSALTIAIVALLASTGADGAIIMPPDADKRAAAAPPTDGFSLSAVKADADKVLASVEGGPTGRPDPYAAQAPTEPLPETATWLMMILGFFGLSFAVRRRAPPAGDRVRFT